MSTSVENRVLEMQFNNQQFERNIRQSTDSLDRLKKGLDLKEASNGLDELDKTAKRFSLRNLTDGVEHASQRLTAMGIIGVTALVNITNQAVNAGKQLVSAFTIDPVRSGFQEYETQINAVQTILANTSKEGTTLEQVNNALDELNHYADLTIYNFTEMTRNIGTFTAAGVDLDTSVAAIKGIANLAAVSGSTSLQASTAMYQLSQALAAGTVKLQDWNSVVNAGMGGQVFQDALKETAEVHGIAIDKMIERDGSFRETLQHGWLTSAILTETLAKFTGDLTEEQLKSMGYTEQQIKGIMKMGVTANDAATKVKTFTQLMDTLKEAAQSGWTQTWEILIGDFEEAKAMLTKVSDVFSEMLNDAAEKRNKILQSWKIMGGRDRLLSAIYDIFDGIMSIIKPIYEAFRDIFPEKTAMQLLIFTNHFKEFTSALKLSTDSMENLKSTARGVFALIDLALLPIKALIKAIFELLGMAAPVGSSFLEITAYFGELIVSIDEAAKASGIFETIFSQIAKVASLFGGGMLRLAAGITSLFLGVNDVETGNLAFYGENLKGALEPITNIGHAVADSLQILIDALNSVGEQFMLFAEPFGAILGMIANLLNHFYEDLTFEKLFNLLIEAAKVFTTIKLIEWMYKFKESLETFDAFHILDSISGAIKKFTGVLKAKTIMTLAQALLVLAGALLLLSFIPEGRLVQTLTAVTILFIEMMVAVSAIAKFLDPAKLKHLIDVTTGMLLLGLALLSLSAAMALLGTLDWAGVAKGLISVAGLMAILITTTKYLDTSTKRLIRVSIGLIVFAKAINALVTPVIRLSELDYEGLEKGLLGVGVLCLELVAFLNLLNGKLGLGTATGLVILAYAISELSNSVITLSSLDTKAFIQGLQGVGVLLLELSAFVNLSKGATKMLSVSAGMLILAHAISVLTESLQIIGSMDVNVLMQGLQGVAIGLLEMTVALNAVSKGALGKGAGFLLLAEGLSILADALILLGGMKWEEIAKGLTAIGVALIIMIVGLDTVKGSAIFGAAALTMLATALWLLVPPFIALSNISVKQLQMGLLSLASIILVIVGLSNILAAASPAIRSASLSLFLFGLSLMSITIDITLISIALTTLMGAFAGASAAISVFIISLVRSFPEMAQTFVDTLTILLVGLGEASAAIFEALTQIGSALLDSLLTLAPKIADTFFGLLLSLLDAFDKYLPLLLDGVKKIFAYLLSEFQSNWGPFMDSVGELFGLLIEFLQTKGPEMLDAGFKLAIQFIDGLREAIENNLGPLLDSLGALAWQVVVEFGNALVRGKDFIFGKVKEFLQPMLDSAKEFVPKFLAKAKELFDGLVGKINEYFPIIKENGKELLHNLLRGIADEIGELVELAVEIMLKFADTLASQLPIIADAGFKIMIELLNALGETAEENIPMLMNAFYDLGGHIIDGMVKGIKDGFNRVIAPIKDLGTKALETLKDRLGIESPSKEFAELGEYSVEGYVVGIEENQDMISDSLNTVMDTQLDKFDSNQEEYRQIGVDSMTAMASGYTSSSEMLGKVDFTMQEIVNQFKNWAPKFTDVGTEHILAYVEGFSSKSSLILGQVDLTMQEVMNQMASWGPKLSGIVGNDSVTMTGLMNGIQNDSSVTLGKVDKSMQEIIEQMKTYLPQFEEIGKEIITNIGNGIQNNSSVAMGGFDYIAQQILNQIHQWFPKFFDAGTQSIISYVEGLQGNADYISEVMAQITAAQQAAAQEQTDYQQVGEESIAELAEGFRNKSSVALGTIDYLMQEVINQIRAWFPKFQDAGKFLGESYSQGVRESIEANLKDIAGVTEALGTNAIMGMEEPVENFEQVGQVTVSNLDAGISGNSEQVVTTMTEVMKNTQNVIIEAQPKFQDAGRQTIGSIVNGYKDRMQLAFNTMRTIVDRTLGEITSRYNEFYSAGSQLVDGFILGIRDNIERAAWQAAEMAIAAYRAAMDALDIQSPSRKMQEVGMYTAMGFAEGIRDNAYLAEDQSSSMAITTLDRLKEAMSGIDDYISNDVDLNPTITPVLDLSNISKNKTKLNQLLKGSKSIGANLAYSTAQTFDKNKTPEVQTTQSQPQNVQFVQNNYSPKALSRLEIYRQTKNQFMAYKEGLV